MNKWLKRSLITAAVVICVVGTGLGFLAYDLYRSVGVAEGYKPSCPDTDQACATWTTFRRSHPFPYQSIAVGKPSPGTWIIVVSEPPPSVSKSDLLILAKKAFGEGVRTDRYKWMIGDDGWLEDLVIRLQAAEGDESAAAASVRDGVALLHGALFGTTFNGEVESIVERLPGAARSSVANLYVTPRELSQWLGEASLTWHRAAGDVQSAGSWDEIESARLSGAFLSSDGTLAMLTFPASVLSDARADSTSLARLQVPFREFAVASESVVGGLWTKSGHIALIARVRTSPQQNVPPLRFETFAVLASAAMNTDELAQSYERNQPFAGKVMSLPYRKRDWAPIYLSPELIDTEFGALLNITDQMLKSWSSAGQIEYLYFNYKKPGAFPFNNRDLSDVVRKETGENTLLFNWNTAGAAVVAEGGGRSVLTSGSTGSLPITYGAGGKTAAQGGADMYAHEDEAYAYFSSLADPNLQRVVQYTVIYQILRAASKDLEISGTSGPPLSSPGIAAAEKAKRVLAIATKSLIKAYTDNPGLLEPALSSALSGFLKENESLGTDGLAALLSDRNSTQAKSYYASKATELQRVQDGLRAREKDLQRRARDYNDRVDNLKKGATPDEETLTRVLTERSAMNTESAALNADIAAFNAKAQGNLAETATQALSEIAIGNDSDPVRLAYVREFAHEPAGSIRTPSIVVSWSSKATMTRVGGHNLDSRTLRFEPTPGIKTIELNEGADGTTTLRYDPRAFPNMESAAPKIARALEHRAERDVSKLQALARDSSPTRTRADALKIVEAAAPLDHPPVFAKIGERVYEDKASFVDDARILASQSDCCSYVIHNAEGTAYIAEPNVKPPPGARVYEIFDTPSMVEHLRRASADRVHGSGGRTLIFLDQPVGYADALAKDLSDYEGAAARLSAGSGGGPPKPPDGRATFFGQPDFDGKPSWLRSLLGPIEGAKRKLFALMNDRVPSKAWQEASVDVMEAPEIEQHLKLLHWDSSVDGVPVAVKVSVREGDGSIARDMAIIAGVDKASDRSFLAKLQTTSEAARADAAARSASAAQYLSTVRNRVMALDEKQLRRLVTVMKSGETQSYFSRNSIVASPAHG